MDEQCSWLCAPHLRRCCMEKRHKDDCMCDRSNCAAVREAQVARIELAIENKQ